MNTILHSVGSLEKLLLREKPSSVCIVTSKKLLPNVRWAILSLKKLKPRTIIIPDGEAAKDWDVLKALLEAFSRLPLDRSSVVIALGGGTVGDIAGFAASIYLRGIRYIQIPTTLLAQADSAHGGKTGIDFLGIKNQIGTFSAPIAIVVDPRFLSSLLRPQIIDGLGEIIKCGLIKDASILSLLQGETLQSLAKGKKLPVLTRKGIAVKNHYAAKDALEKRDRAFLNFGHTFGHAIELRYGLSHGYSVILGCLKELELGEKLGITRPSVRMRLTSILKGLEIPIRHGLSADPKILSHDKKASDGKIILPLVSKEGRSKLFKIELKELIQQWKK